MSTTVLIVEDNERSQRVARDALRHAGYAVHCAVSGEEAIAWAAQSMADVVLLDIHLPGIDGIETFRRLRSLPGWQTVPIVAMTASVMPDERSLIRAKGFDGMVDKPWNPIEVLEAAVAAALTPDKKAS